MLSECDFVVFAWCYGLDCEFNFEGCWYLYVCEFIEILVCEFDLDL